MANEHIQMQKQLKSLKYKSKKKKVLKLKALKKYNLIFRIKSTIFKPKFLSIVKSLKETKKIKMQINIKLTPNNVFCTLRNLSNSKTLLARSSGSYKLNVSKKKLKFSNKLILNLFLKEVKMHIKNVLLIVQLSGPLKLRKVIIKQLSTQLRAKELVIKTKELKCFNGCRVKKKKRKKQRSLKVYK